MKRGLYRSRIYLHLDDLLLNPPPAPDRANRCGRLFVLCAGNEKKPHRHDSALEKAKEICYKPAVPASGFSSHET